MFTNNLWTFFSNVAASYKCSLAKRFYLAVWLGKQCSSRILEKKKKLNSHKQSQYLFCCSLLVIQKHQIEQRDTKKTQNPKPNKQKNKRKTSNNNKNKKENQIKRKKHHLKKPGQENQNSAFTWFSSNQAISYNSSKSFFENFWNCLFTALMKIIMLL